MVTLAQAAGIGPGRLDTLEGTVDWLTNKVYRTEDRVDRLYAQARIFTINSQALEAM